MKCIVKDCQREIHYKKHKLCKMHGLRYYRHGDPNYHERVVGENRSKDPLYRRWWAMRQRCYLPSCDQYRNYGARGIKVCDRWLGVDGFTHFKEDMGEPPEGWSIDRIDVNGNYCPENCRWASPVTQRINRRDYKNSHPGVYYNKSRNKWEARLKVKGKFILCKKYDTLEEAIDARNKAEEEYKDWVYGEDQTTTLQ